MTTNRTPWTPSENAALAALYFRMLDGVRRSGDQLNKASLIRVARGEGNDYDNRSTSCERFAGQLANRSRGSIEAKLMNASAAHGDIAPNAETMAGHGYKAWGNYQASLRDAMAHEMSARGEHRRAVAEYFARAQA